MILTGAQPCARSCCSRRCATSRAASTGRPASFRVGPAGSRRGRRLAVAGAAAASPERDRAADGQRRAVDEASTAASAATAGQEIRTPMPACAAVLGPDVGRPADPDERRAGPSADGEPDRPLAVAQALGEPLAPGLRERSRGCAGRRGRRGAVGAVAAGSGVARPSEELRIPPADPLQRCRAVPLGHRLPGAAESVHGGQGSGPDRHSRSEQGLQLVGPEYPIGGRKGEGYTWLSPSHKNRRSNQRIGRQEPIQIGPPARLRSRIPSSQT